MAATRSAIGPEKQGLESPIGARLSRSDTMDAIAQSLIQFIEAGGTELGPKVLPLRALMESDGTVNSGFIQTVKAIGGRSLRLVLYYKEGSAESAQADVARLALNGMAFIVGVNDGEILPQLEATVPGIQTNGTIQLSAADFKDFKNSVWNTQASNLNARFVILPTQLPENAQLSPVEKFVLLFLADAHRVLTAVGDKKLYDADKNLDPALRDMLNKGWAAFLAVPIKILEELRQALVNLQATAPAA